MKKFIKKIILLSSSIRNTIILIIVKVSMYHPRLRSHFRYLDSYASLIFFIFTNLENVWVGGVGFDNDEYRHTWTRLRLDLSFTHLLYWPYPCLLYSCVPFLWALSLWPEQIIISNHPKKAVRYCWVHCKHRVSLRQSASIARLCSQK